MGGRVGGEGTHFWSKTLAFLAKIYLNLQRFLQTYLHVRTTLHYTRFGIRWNAGSHQ